MCQLPRLNQSHHAFVEGNAGTDEDREDDEVARGLLGPLAAKQERGTEWERGQRVAHIVNQVGEESDTVGEHEDRGLRERGREQHDQADRNCADARAGANDRWVNQSMRVAMRVGVRPIAVIMDTMLAIVVDMRVVANRE
jgi:hypothetical protein